MFNVYTHFVKFEYKEMKSVGVTDYTNQTPPQHFRWKKCLSSTPLKKEILFNKIQIAHLQFLNNHDAKMIIKE